MALMFITVIFSVVIKVVVKGDLLGCGRNRPSMINDFSVGESRGLAMITGEGGVSSGRTFTELLLGVCGRGSFRSVGFSASRKCTADLSVAMCS